MDMSDCVNDVQVRSLPYWSDHDEIHVAVVKSFVRADVQLISSSHGSVGVTTRAER